MLRQEFTAILSLYLEQASPKLRSKLSVNPNQGGFLEPSMPASFAELAWINALMTNALHGASPGFYRHTLLTYSRSVLFSLLIHPSTHLFIR